MQQCRSVARKDSNLLFRSPHLQISVEMVLSRLVVLEQRQEKVTLQREGFKRPASQHSGWSQLCRRRTFKRLLKVEI